jgi:2',3'-cyclic-nucleotide 2'-phosphodiesterase (5'-nucleotidase family)
LVALVACSLSSGIAPTNGGVPATAAGSIERVVLLYTNDLHGQVEPLSGQSGGLVNLVSLIDQVRAEDPDRTLLLDAGDTMQGTYVANSTRGEVVVEAMNIAGYDGWAMGNHEFEWGPGTLRARISQARFPALAANLYDATTGQLWDAVKPYTIVQAGHVRVAIVGLSAPNTPALTKPQNVTGLEFRPAGETLRSILPEVQAQASLIIVLSHLGIEGDRALAQAVDGIDVIVGGHTHLALARPEVVNGTLIVSAGSKGQWLGELDLEVDTGTGKVTSYSRDDLLLPVAGKVSPVNLQVRKLVDAALAQVAATKNQPIGKTARALEPAREGEFALGNLVVDGMRSTGVGDGQPVDVAFHNNAGMRAGLPKGPITYGQLYDVLPFNNQLMAMDLTGAQILRILEHSVTDRAGSLQVSGLSFRFDFSRPASRRVLEATIGGQPLDPEKTYRVVTIDFLAGGGDGFKTFLDGTNVAYGDEEVWAVAEYIRAHSPVDPRVEGRIR